MKVLKRSEIIIGTVWDQETMKKTSTKISSTREVMERREAKTSVNFIKVYTTVMLNASST